MSGQENKSEPLWLIPQLDKTEFIGEISPENGAYLFHFTLTFDPSSESGYRAAVESQQHLGKFVSQSLGGNYLIAQLANQQVLAAKQVKSSFTKLQLCSLAGYVLLIAVAIVAILTGRVTTQITMGIIMILGIALSVYLASTLLPQYRDAVRRVEKLEDRLERCSEHMPEKRNEISPTAEHSNTERSL